MGQALQYSIPAVNGATSYTWTLPNGWTGSSTTTSISTVGSSAGTISVTANGSCGSSTAQTLVVAPTLVPSQPNAIVGNSNYCQGSQELYSVNPVSGATSYTWTLPNGWTGSSTSNSIAANTATLGTISVVANGECGNSTPQTLSVAPAALPNQPTSISGNDTICAGVATNYFIEPVQGANSYVWTTSGGLTGSSTSNSIDILGESTGGVITVTAQNICLQTGPTASLELQVLSLDTSVVLNGSELVANAVDVSYQWLDCNNGFAPISNETAQSFIIPGIGSYALEVSRNGCIATSSCIEIEVVGLSNQPSNNLVVYPNPASETITIKTSKPVEIYMYNALGAVVDHFELNGSKEINIAHLANGMYILQTNGYGNYRLIKH